MTWLDRLFILALFWYFTADATGDAMEFVMRVTTGAVGFAAVLRAKDREEER